MNEYKRLVNNEIDSIDAAVFSGDLFLDEDNRKDFREWMARWERKLVEYDEIPESDDEVEKDLSDLFSPDDDDWMFSPNDGA